MSIRSFFRNLFSDTSSSRPFDYVLGLGEVSVPPHCTATLSASPDVAFRPSHMAIPSAVSQHFMVCDVQIDRRRQLVSPGRVPAVLFAEYPGPCMMIDVAEPGMFVSVTLYNSSDEERVIQVGLYGPVV